MRLAVLTAVAKSFMQNNFADIDEVPNLILPDDLFRVQSFKRHKPKKQFFSTHRVTIYYSAIRVMAPCSQVLTHFLQPLQASGLTTLACLWMPRILILPRTCWLHPSTHLKHAWHLCGSRSINFVLCGLPGLKLNSFIRVAN